MSDERNERMSDERMSKFPALPFKVQSQPEYVAAKETPLFRWSILATMLKGRVFLFLYSDRLNSPNPLVESTRFGSCRLFICQPPKNIPYTQNFREIHGRRWGKRECEKLITKNVQVAKNGTYLMKHNFFIL